MNPNRPVATVTELVRAIKSRLEPYFPDFWVKGEISNFRGYHASGHLYFTLKDPEAAISVAMFGAGKKKLPFDLKDGLEVLLHGRITVYPQKGYQIVADQIEPAGIGALQLAYEQLKEKLSKEGLFDERLKKPIPQFPSHLYIITSDTAAALQDVLSVLSRRAPHVQKTLIPTPVQGQDAIPKILQSMHDLKAHLATQSAQEYEASTPVLLMVRGGGSIEDLWCFNDESICRAIRDFPIPVITGIGHEIDFTLADFASDRRAPTPSVAAEMVTNGWWTAREWIEKSKLDLSGRIDWLLQFKKNQLVELERRLVSPVEKLRFQQQRLDDLWEQLDRSIQITLERKRNLFKNILAPLEALSPVKVLARGYSVLYDEKGHVLTQSNRIARGEKIRFQLSSGGGYATVTEVEDSAM